MRNVDGSLSLLLHVSSVHVHLVGGHVGVAPCNSKGITDVDGRVEPPCWNPKNVTHLLHALLKLSLGASIALEQEARRRNSNKRVLLFLRSAYPGQTANDAAAASSACCAQRYPVLLKCRVCAQAPRSNFQTESDRQHGTCYKSRKCVFHRVRIKIIITNPTMTPLMNESHRI